MNEILNLPAVGLGCWSFGGGDYWGNQSPVEVERIVSAALELGQNYFDTAEVYNDGESERSLGQALGKRRKTALIGSKMWPPYNSSESIVKHCEGSLSRLGTDYLDIYMIHWPPETKEGYEAAAEGMSLLLKQGKIRRGGVSNFGILQMAEAEAAGLDFSVNQLMYNVLSRAAEFQVAPRAAEMEVGVMGYMPLLQGLLSGKYSSASEVPPVRMRSRHFDGSREGSRHGEPGYEALVFDILKAIIGAASGRGLAPAAVSLAWCLSRSEIACEIIGVRSMAQLETSSRSQTISKEKELMDEITGVSEELKMKMGENIDYWESSSNSRSR